MDPETLDLLLRAASEALEMSSRRKISLLE